MKQPRRSRGIALLGGGLALALALLFLPVEPADAQGSGGYRCGDPAQVYYGNARLFRRPCEISADEVYRHIPEYREIVENGLTDRDPRYHLLMRKASERFSKAVKDAAVALRHDLVAERGAIEVDGDDTPRPPDRTSEVVSRIG